MLLNQKNRNVSGSVLNYKILLGSKLVAWWNFKEASNLGFGSGTDISQVNDLSGNGYHATQATGANQPNYDSTNKCVTFSGSDFLSTSLTTALPFGIFAKVNNKKVTGGTSPIVAGSGGANNNALIGFPSSQSYKYGIYAGTLVTTGSTQQNTIGVYGAEFNSSTTDYLYVNGTQSTGNAGNSVASNLWIGKSDTPAYFIGDMYEIIIVNAALNAYQLTMINRLLSK